jgi:hypothetical protein
MDVIVPGFAPVMTIGYADSRVYWGMSDSYVVNVTGFRV